MSIKDIFDTVNNADPDGEGDRAKTALATIVSLKLEGTQLSMQNLVNIILQHRLSKVWTKWIQWKNVNKFRSNDAKAKKIIEVIQEFANESSCKKVISEIVSRKLEGKPMSSLQIVWAMRKNGLSDLEKRYTNWMKEQKFWSNRRVRGNKTRLDAERQMRINTLFKQLTTEIVACRLEQPSASFDSMSVIQDFFRKKYPAIFKIYTTVPYTELSFVVTPSNTILNICEKAVKLYNERVNPTHPDTAA